MLRCSTVDSLGGTLSIFMYTNVVLGCFTKGWMRSEGIGELSTQFMHALSAVMLNPLTKATASSIWCGVIQWSTRLNSILVCGCLQLTVENRTEGMGSWKRFSRGCPISHYGCASAESLFRRWNSLHNNFQLKEYRARSCCMVGSSLELPEDLVLYSVIHWKSIGGRTRRTNLSGPYEGICILCLPS